MSFNSHRIAVIVSFVFLLPWWGFSAERTYGNAVLDSVLSIHDGDTFTGSINSFPPIVGQRISIRIDGIDTPEMTDKRPNIKQKAQQAKQYTVQRLREGKKIELKNMKRDKYFRILAVVIVDGVSLGDELIEKGYAKKYDGVTKEQW